MIVIVPYRPDHGHRDKLWKHLKDQYWVHQPYELVVGEHLSGPFNRSEAINQAADRPWDVAVIADADTWVPAKQLHHAIELAEQSRRLVAAFNAVVELSQPCTENILIGRTSLAGSFEATKVRTRDLETQSSMLVIHRDLWDRVGGFDPRFSGWGCEDNSFWKACDLHAGTEHVSGNAYHLWHSPARGKGHGIEYRRNLNLWHRYETARTVDELPCWQSA
jgi:hypothetical protein